MVEIGFSFGVFRVEIEGKVAGDSGRQREEDDEDDFDDVRGAGRIFRGLKRRRLGDVRGSSGRKGGSRRRVRGSPAHGGVALGGSGGIKIKRIRIHKPILT